MKKFKILVKNSNFLQNFLNPYKKFKKKFKRNPKEIQKKLKKNSKISKIFKNFLKIHFFIYSRFAGIVLLLA